MLDFLGWDRIVQDSYRDCHHAYQLLHSECVVVAAAADVVLELADAVYVVAAVG